MKMADVIIIENISEDDLGRTVILTSAENKEGHHLHGNVIGILKDIRETDGDRVLLLVDEGVVGNGITDSYIKPGRAVIFPTKSHPLLKAGSLNFFTFEDVDKYFNEFITFTKEFKQKYKCRGGRVIRVDVPDREEDLVKVYLTDLVGAESKDQIQVLEVDRYDERARTSDSWTYVGRSRSQASSYGVRTHTKTTIKDLPEWWNNIISIKSNSNVGYTVTVIIKSIEKKDNSELFSINPICGPSLDVSGHTEVFLKD